MDSPANCRPNESNMKQFMKTHFESSTYYILLNPDGFALEPYRRTSKVDLHISELTKDSACPKDSRILNPTSATAEKSSLTSPRGEVNKILNYVDLGTGSSTEALRPSNVRTHHFGPTFLKK